MFGGVPSAGFCYIDLPRSASLALVCGACGLLSWLCCYERCHFQHFCCVKASFFASGFFFLRIMFSKGLRLCQYYKVTSYRWLVWTWCQQHWRNRLAFQDGRMHRGPSLASTQLCRLFICVSSLPADPTVCYFIMLLPANHIPQDSLLAGSALRAVRRRCQQKIRKGRRDATLPFLLAVSPEVTSFLDTLSLAFPASF